MLLRSRNSSFIRPKPLVSWGLVLLEIALAVPYNVHAETVAVPRTITVDELKMNIPVTSKEVTTGELSFHGLTFPKELTTGQLEFNGLMFPKEVIAAQLLFSGLSFPKDVNTAQLVFSGKISAPIAQPNAPASLEKVPVDKARLPSTKKLD